MTTAIIIVCGLLLAGLLAYRRRFSGTTLVGPWIWSGIATAALLVVELGLAAGLLHHAGAWRFVAAMATFCPAMSLLGAKRPQDHGWHFIVVSLWGMLALPAMESLLLRPGQALAVVDFRAYFVLALVGINLLIFLPTRFWLAALLFAVGQLALVWSYLPHVEQSPTMAFILTGCLLMLAAFLAVVMISHRRHPPGFDRLWLDFRDAYGALWGARVLERVNAAAVSYRWPFQLGWWGFYAVEPSSRAATIPPELDDDLRQVMANLLRRFVSPAWIDERLGAAPAPPEHQVNTSP